MTAPRPDDDLPRDAHLLAALRHAPDADEGVDPALRERILSRARGLAPPGRPAPAAATWWSRWARALRPGTPWGAAFASLVLGTVIVMVWRDGTPPAVVEPDAPAGDIVAREVAASEVPSREAATRDAAARLASARARAEAEAVDAEREARHAQAKAKAAKAAAEVRAPRMAPPEVAAAPSVTAAGITAPPPPVADTPVTATPVPAASPAPAAAPAPAATTATAVAAAKAPAASSEAGPPARPVAVARAQVMPPPASAAALPRTAREALGSALSLAPAPATARADVAPDPLDGWRDGDSPWIPRLRALDAAVWALRPPAEPPATAVSVGAPDGRRGRLWLEPGDDGGARLRWQPAAGAPVWEQALSAPALDPWLAAGLRPPG